MRGLLLTIFAEWRAKLFWALVLNVYFYIGYPLLQRHHLGEPMLIPPSAVDRLVPFLPGTAWLYLSLVLYLPLAPMLMTTSAALRRYGCCALAITTVGYVFFFFLPTTMTRPPPPDGHALYSWLAATDLALNEFPSLHAAYTVFTAIVLARMLREYRAAPVWRIANLIWAVAIVATTLTTRQHVFVDILGGTLLGSAAAAFFLREKR